MRMPAVNQHPIDSQRLIDRIENALLGTHVEYESARDEIIENYGYDAFRKLQEAAFQRLCGVESAPKGSVLQGLREEALAQARHREAIAKLSNRTPTQRAEHPHPRVMCFHCGAAVGYGAGAQWEFLQRCYEEWVSLGKPSRDPKGHSIVSQARRFASRADLSSPRGPLPPTCCKACREALRLKKKALLAAQHAEHECVICGLLIRSGPDAVVCSPKCGRAFVKQAIASTFSFELGEPDV